MATGDPKCDKHKREGCLCGDRWDREREASGPLGGAAAVRELTSKEWTRDALGVVGAGIVGATTADVEPIAAAMTADVEHDGDRGPRAFRDPLSVLDQAADAARAQAVQRLMSAVGALSVDEVAALAWVAWQLPGRKLRRKCEEATATGWCRTEEPKPTARSTPEDRARAALLAAWRQVVALVHGAQSTAAREVAQRDRGDVLADEAARRAGGGE